MQKAVFYNIESELITYIEKAENSIRIAVTWFTNKSLLDALLNKLGDDFTIELILTSDDINFSKKGLDFKSFISKGGKLYVQNSGRLMHHKFCIIDDVILINGSYNWTQLAETSNNENVIVFENEYDLVNEFSEEFSRIANADGILINAIPFFKSEPVFSQPVYESIEYINSNNELGYEKADDVEYNIMNTFRVGKIYSFRSFNGVRFIPMWIYRKNCVMISGVLYFAWENDYDLSIIQTLKKDDFFAIGEYRGIIVDDRFPEFFWKTAKEENWYRQKYRFSTEGKVCIELFIKKGETVYNALKNLGFDLNGGKFYIN